MEETEEKTEPVTECELHDWKWEKDDKMGCPVCYGMGLERHNIIDMLDKRVVNRHMSYGISPLDTHRITLVVAIANIKALANGEKMNWHDWRDRVGQAPDGLFD